MGDLFDHLPSPAPAGKSSGQFATVAVEQAVDRELDYIVPSALAPEIAVGQRVKVPLGRGNRDSFGYVVAIKTFSDYNPAKLKAITRIDDARLLVNAQLLELARWMSRYYLTPLGTVLESLLPAAVKKRTGVEQITIVHAALSREEMAARLAAAKRGKVGAVIKALLELAEGEGIELVRLAQMAKVTPATLRKLAGSGLLRLSRKADFGLPALEGEEAFVPQEALALNPEQQKAYDALGASISAGRFNVGLLHGITGSGKTEVYLQCIAKVVAAGKQAVVLVPEIALTPQTAQRFTRRFRHVAVLHSGLSAGDRHAQWRSIAAGRAQVIIGARSAVFAPAPDLGLIVVDEEHESSYKQETAPRYHARDVAIKRAQMQNIPIILGSATPSLEMYHRIRSAALQENRQGQGGNPPGYQYLVLSSRATVQQLPKVDLIDMKQANIGRPGIHLLSPQLEKAMGQTFAQGQQAILLLNRRGYASFLWCPSCGSQIKCKFCDVGMVYHRDKQSSVGSGRSDLAVHSGTMHCHYCLASNALPAACPDCGKRLSLFGLGTQRVEEELKRKFPDLSFARMDSDTMHRTADYERVLGGFAAGKTQMLMGTQMIAKGLDFPNVTLVGVISADTALMLPDFRAAERTFQLITQVAGRAGRGKLPGRVIVQTFMPEDRTIRDAIAQDYSAFAARELNSRREQALPPFARMLRIVFRDSDEQRVQAMAREVGEQMGPLVSSLEHVRMEGPMECSISRIAGYFRRQIVLTSPRPGALQEAIAPLRKSGTLMKGDRIAIDVDPLSLL